MLRLLGQIIDAVGFEGLQGVGVEGGGENDGQREPGPLNELEPGAVLEVNVEQEQIGMAGLAGTLPRLSKPGQALDYRGQLGQHPDGGVALPEQAGQPLGAAGFVF